MSFCPLPFDWPLARFRLALLPSISFILISLVLFCSISWVDSALEASVAHKDGIGEFASLTGRTSPILASLASGSGRHRTSSVVTFTGNAFEDFSNGSIAIHDDGNLPIGLALGGFLEDTDVRSVMVGQRSGFDIRNVFWKYDVETDTMFVGVDCYGVCGDIDGDGDPDEASLPFSLLGGDDAPSLSRSEFLMIALDTNASDSDLDMTVEVLIGSKFKSGLSQLGFQNFSIQIALNPLPFPILALEDFLNFSTHSNFTLLNPSNTHSPSISGLVDPSIYLASHDFNSSFGDIEFAITHFSSLPGIHWNPSGAITPSSEPGYGKMSFSFKTVLGSFHNLALVGTDHLPNQTLGHNRGHRIIIECPWLPLDSLGLCCNFDERDLCGVCFGNNANLDPCGSCRWNATGVPTSSCPAAVSNWSMIDTMMETNEIEGNFPFISVDINLDGLLDLVIGIPSLNLAYIRFLDSNGLVSGTATIRNPNTNSQNEFDEFGASIASPGDVNGDGVPDLVISAPGFNNTGIVYVILMQSSGQVQNFRTIDSGLVGNDPLQSAFPNHSCSPKAAASVPSTSRKGNAGHKEEFGEPYGDPDFFHSPDPPIPAEPDDTIPSAPVSISSPYITPESSPSEAEPAIYPISESPPSYAPECIPPEPSSDYPTARFGMSLVWLGRYMLLISAPGAPAQNSTPLPTPFSQHGRLLLVALATDGNAIGMYTLSTILTNTNAIAAGLNVSNVADATLGRYVRLAGTVGPNSRLVASIHWTLKNGGVKESMILINVKPDGSIQNMRSIIFPPSPFLLPSFPLSPLLPPPPPILPPNFFPMDPYTGSVSLEGTGDVNGDGAPDLIFGLQYSSPSGESQHLLMACILDNFGIVRGTQLIGLRGIGHLSLDLPPGYRFGSFIHKTSSLLPIGGLLPTDGTTTLLISAIHPNSSMLVVPISLWGISSSNGPTNPSQPFPPMGPPSPPPNVPIGLSPSSIAPPSPTYPLVPRPSTDAVGVEFIGDAPQMKVYCFKDPSIYTILTLDRIVERSSQGGNPGAPIPLKTLRPPPASAWTKQVSSDGLQTAFTANLVTDQGTSTNVELQVQIATFKDDKTIIFSPSSYLGVTEESIKFSFLLRGWTFTQSKTVIDIMVDVKSNDPIISVDSESVSQTERYTRFILGSISSQTSLTIPSFASIDGVLASVSPPRFNQTTGLLTLTAPPFFDSLFYDPDVAIKMRYDPAGIKQGEPKLSRLLWIIIPSVIGLIIIVAIVSVLVTWLCRHRKAEQRWKDAGEVTEP